MAKNQRAAALPSADDDRAPQARQEPAQEAPAPEHRTTVPQAPRPEAEGDRQLVADIRTYVQAAVYTVEPLAVDQAAEYVRSAPMRGAHPSVRAYQAECLDYLAFRAKRVRGE